MTTFREPPRAATLAVVLARRFPDATPYLIACAVRDMQSATAAAKAWETRRCNEPMDEAQEARGQRRIDRLEAKATMTIARCANTYPPADLDHAATAAWVHAATGVSVECGGDPRGPCGSLVIAGSKGDGWGDGFAIY